MVSKKRKSKKKTQRKPKIKDRFESDRLQENLQFIRRNYEKPGHPIAFSSPGVIYKYLKTIQRDTKLSAIKEVLQEFDGYTLHRQTKRPKIYNPYYIYGRRMQIQADLVDVRQLSEKNNGITYLLVLIDAFTRKGWAYGLKNKTSKETADAMRKHIEHDPASRLFSICMTDKGMEFLGAPFLSLLEEYSITHQSATGWNKLSIGERFNQTLQLLIYKHLSNNETERYIDQLPKLLETYNKRPHRSLRGLTPDFADMPKNEVLIRGIIRERFANIPRSKKSENEKFNVGDIVRIKKLSPKISTERRGYMPQYHRTYYVIDKVDLRLPRTMFHLSSLAEQEPVIGGFYSQELSKISGDVWKVEKVLKTRGKAPNREYFVKWENFPDKFNSWISEKNVTRTY